jgi:hypothetical protein
VARSCARDRVLIQRAALNCNSVPQTSLVVTVAQECGSRLPMNYLSHLSEGTSAKLMAPRVPKARIVKDGGAAMG